MSPELWVYAGLGLVVALHLALFVYTYRSRLPWGGRQGAEASTGAGSDAGERGAEALASDAPTVQCRECGAENEADYRFCRRCVADLSGRTAAGPGGARSDSRELF